MLSRLRVTVADSLAEYSTLCQKVFGASRPFSSGLFPRTKYNYKILESALQDIITRRGLDCVDGVQNFRSDEDLCKTKVVLATELDATPYMFNTYGVHLQERCIKVPEMHLGSSDAGGIDPSQEILTWQVARASFALPIHFPPFKIETSFKNDPMAEFSFISGDLSFQFNNQYIYRDIMRQSEDPPKRMGAFVRIGDGNPRFLKPASNLLFSFRNAEASIYDSCYTNKSMKKLSQEDGFPYYPFDGDRSLRDVKLDQWEKIAFDTKNKKPQSTAIEQAIHAYLDQPIVQHDLEQCAKLLVERRRLRARDASAWDRYAYASFYQCSYQGCPVPQHRFKRVEQFQEHVMQTHSSALAEKLLDQAVKESRRCWEYKNQPT
ncbi:MAG: hypothetical protein L6R41_002986 [Letrouitia leprolyta]|nr:MAG: hypothetical protein L6R41_002986 [Letrouitia leprolyta]